MMFVYWISKLGNGWLLVVDLVIGNEILFFMINCEGSQNYVWKYDNSGFYMMWLGQCLLDIYEFDF